MEVNEVKKTLYKTGQSASLMNVRRDGIVYQTVMEGGEIITFVVPLEEVGDVVWMNEMPAKLLIRYISLNEFS